MVAKPLVDNRVFRIDRIAIIEIAITSNHFEAFG